MRIFIIKDDVRIQIKENEKAFDLLYHNIYGLGRVFLQKIFSKYGLKLTIKSENIPIEIFNSISIDIGNFRVVGRALKNYNFQNILKYQKVQNYRGLRHMTGFPCRGQRTRSNAVNAKKMKSIVQSYKTLV
jgi:small subunit ribosomal protein S13